MLGLEAKWLIDVKDIEVGSHSPLTICRLKVKE